MSPMQRFEAEFTMKYRTSEGFEAVRGRINRAFDYMVHYGSVEMDFDGGTHEIGIALARDYSDLQRARTGMMGILVGGLMRAGIAIGFAPNWPDENGTMVQITSYHVGVDDV